MSTRQISLFFTPLQKSTSDVVKLLIAKKEIKQEKFIKHLGLHIDSHLSWEFRILHIKRCILLYYYYYYYYFFFFFQYNFIEHTHVQLTFTKDNLQQNENYNLKLTKKEPNTIKALVVTKIKRERNQLSEQNFIRYLKETKKQTILF